MESQISNNMNSERCWKTSQQLSPKPGLNVTRYFDQWRQLKRALQDAIVDAFTADGLSKLIPLVGRDVIVRSGKAMWKNDPGPSPRPSRGTTPKLHELIEPVFHSIDLDQVADSINFEHQITWEGIIVTIYVDSDNTGEPSDDQEVFFTAYVWVGESAPDRFMAKLCKNPLRTTVPVAEASAAAKVECPSDVTDDYAAPQVTCPKPARKRPRVVYSSSSDDEDDE